MDLLGSSACKCMGTFENCYSKEPPTFPLLHTQTKNDANTEDHVAITPQPDIQLQTLQRQHRSHSPAWWFPLSSTKKTSLFLEPARGFSLQKENKFPKSKKIYYDNKLVTFSLVNISKTKFLNNFYEFYLFVFPFVFQVPYKGAPLTRCDVQAVVFCTSPLFFTPLRNEISFSGSFCWWSVIINQANP